MSKRHERLKIANQIEDTLENYCRAGCPFASSDEGLHPNCRTCPPGVEIRSLGSKLGGKEERRGGKPSRHIPDEYLQKAKRNGVPERTVRRRLANGVPLVRAVTKMERRNGWTDEETKTLLELINARKTHTEISVVLGRTKSAVGGRLKRLREAERV